MTDTTDQTEFTRPFTDPLGEGWEAVGVEDIVAHGKLGMRLAFRRQGRDPGVLLPSRVTFNSRRAADFALRTLGEKELLRRLTLAQAEAGAV